MNLLAVECMMSLLIIFRSLVSLYKSRLRMDKYMVLLSHNRVGIHELFTMIGMFTNSEK